MLYHNFLWYHFHIYTTQMLTLLAVVYKSNAIDVHKRMLTLVIIHVNHNENGPLVNIHDIPQYSSRGTNTTWPGSACQKAFDLGDLTLVGMVTRCSSILSLTICM